MSSRWWRKFELFKQVHDLFADICTMARGHLLLQESYLRLLLMWSHAQRGLQYLLCVSVCVFVCYRSSSYSIRFSLQPRHSFQLVDFRKTLPFKSYGEKKAICKLHRQPFSRTFWTYETLEAQPVSRIFGAAGVK